MWREIGYEVDCKYTNYERCDDSVLQVCAAFTFVGSNDVTAWSTVCLPKLLIQGDWKAPVHLWKNGGARCWVLVRHFVEIPCQVILVHLQVKSLPHLKDKIPWHPFVHRDLHSNPYNTSENCTRTFKSPCTSSCSIRQEINSVHNFGHYI
jgi:hypothetical protein